MATLSKHGQELYREKRTSGDYVICADGNVLRNEGDGWKVYGKVKASSMPQELVKLWQEKAKKLSPAFIKYRNALIEYTSLKTRALVHTAVQISHHDPDGVWADLDDYGIHLDFDDVQELCALYEKKEGK